MPFKHSLTIFINFLLHCELTSPQSFADKKASGLFKDLKMMQTASHKLHEAWALAGLLRARYGIDALPRAMDEASKHSKDPSAAPIWIAVVECLSH
jgi:hypothetical protein